MQTRDQKTVEQSEISFYKNIYKTEAFNQLGNQLRLKRELNSLLFLAQTRDLNKVLSIGCGSGQFEILLAPYAEHITAVDISPEAIELAKKNQAAAGVKNINFKCQSFSDLNWDEQFDAVICLAFLHHVPESDLESFLQKVYDHIKPRGFFYSQDPNINGVLRKVGRIVLGNKYDKYHTPDERELDPNDLIGLLRDVGFNSFKINHLDLTVIPAIYMLTRGYNWLMYLCLVIDFLWSKSLFAPWASGFAMISWKK